MDYRGPAKGFRDGKHIGPGPWLDVIHECNRIHHERYPTSVTEPFGSPESTGPWWPGSYVEEYHSFRVLMSEDDTVSIHSKTEVAGKMLAEALARLGL